MYGPPIIIGPGGLDGADPVKDPELDPESTEHAGLPGTKSLSLTRRRLVVMLVASFGSETK